MLQVYKQASAGVYTPYAIEDLEQGYSPLIITQDGSLGGSYEAKLFVRNDDPTEYYTNIQITPYSKVSPSEVDGTSTGYGVKLKSGKTQPTEGEWEDVDYANTISISSIGSSSQGDTSSYRPFWARFEIPAGASASNRENVNLRVSFKANPVS